MDVTFGIITDGSEVAKNRINKIIDSIELLNIPNYEIIVLGNLNIDYRNNLHIYEFNEEMRPKWITRKKNLITQFAKYENIVYLHDYLDFDINWYNAWKDKEYLVGTNVVLNSDGSRFRDWHLSPWDYIPRELKEVKYRLGIPELACLMPYDTKGMSKYQYINGSYWIAKKHVMEEFYLDENRLWGEGEDVEWSYRVACKYNFTFNSEAIVRNIGNFKDVVFSVLSKDEMNSIKKLLNIEE